MKNKLKRRRTNSTHRWTEKETLLLLNNVVNEIKENPEFFEKPTAQKFYMQMDSKYPSLQSINWLAKKNKMRYLKTGFIKAMSWKQQTGSGLLENGEEHSVAEYIDKMCPHFDLLSAIFGQCSNVPIQCVYVTNDINNESEVVKQYLLEETPVENDECPTITPMTTNTTKKKVKKYEIETLLKIQEKKFKLIAEKMKKKFKKNIALEMKKLELQHQLELRRMELESEERIKKYEIDCKYKNAQNM